MKTSNNILMLCLIASLTLFSSCKKDKTNTAAPTTSTKTNFLTKGPWKVIAQKTKINGSAWIDNFVNMQACELDNTTTFFQNFTVIDDEGASKCDTTDPQSITYNWAFNANETELIFIDGPDTMHYPILILDNNTLRIQGAYIDAQDTINFDVTFAH